MNMGFQYGLEKTSLCIKRPWRWIFEVAAVSADDTVGVNSLPPEKSSRPSISFKEMEVRHLIEDVYYPGKPEWKPITLTLYDLVLTNNPVFAWIQNAYNPPLGTWNAPVIQTFNSANLFIKNCYLKMYDGCGTLLETWTYEDAWPQAVNWGQLDMGGQGFMTVDVTLRYARAYVS